MSRVLITEDSPAIRLLLVRRLEMAGHEVIQAGNGEEALAILGSCPPSRRPEVILLDAMMPVVDGLEVLDVLDRSDMEIPVLTVSALPDLDHAAEWSSAAGHIRKPIDFDDLLEKIETVTSGPPRP